MMMRETGRQRSPLTGNDSHPPDLEELQSTDFTATARLIGLGLPRPRNAERLARLSLDEDTWQRYVAARTGTARKGGRAFRAHGQALERYSERIQAELGPVLGQPLDPVEMDERLSHFYGSDNFEALDYRLVRDGALTGIEVSARQKSWGPNFLRFGLELQNDFQGGNSFNAGVRAQVTEVNRFGAEWQTDLQVGANPLFRTEFYQPIGYTSDWFVVPRLLVERQNLDIFEANAARHYRIDDRELEFDSGREFGSWGELRAGIIRATAIAISRSATDDPGLPPARNSSAANSCRASAWTCSTTHIPASRRSLTLQWNGPRENLGAAPMRTASPSIGRTRTPGIAIRSSCPRPAARMSRDRRTRCRIGTRSAGSSISRGCRRTRSAGRNSGSRARSCTGASATARKACSTCRPTSVFRSSSATSGSSAATRA
jgi:NTE family protein